MHTLLIVDDHESVLKALEFALASDRMRVLSTTSGGAAIELVQREQIDAALVDLHMPGMDGVTLCRRLLEGAQREGRILPVWIMTAAHTGAAAEAAREGGARSLLKKPFDCVEFQQELLRSLEPATAASSDPTTLLRETAGAETKRFTSFLPGPVVAPQ